MQSINEAIDLLQRRAREKLIEDGVHVVYATLYESYTTYVIVLDRVATGDELTKISMHYVRMYQDVSARYNIKVVNADYPVVKTPKTFAIYERGAGFSVSVMRKNTNRNF